MSKKAKITFLGTAGGRFTVIKQLRASGGWMLEMDGEMLHVDPGTGAVVRANQNKFDLTKLTGILVSHNHADHCADAGVMVEAMSRCSRKKRGVIIMNETALKGSDDGLFVPVFSRYHLERVEKHRVLKPGESGTVGKIKITATPTKHGDPKGIGFVFEGSNKIGYTSDGEYVKGQENYFRGCDCLILNCMRPRGEDWPLHMNTYEAKKIIEGARPEMAVLTHFGMKMLRGIAEKEAAWIQKETGITTMAAKDRMVLNLADIGSLKRFI